MKLSMWMIANRLSPLMEIATNIRVDAKPILNSARVAYSTNTAHVYQSGRNVIVEGEGGDHITLFDIRLKEAFEIIQGVFDYWRPGVVYAPGVFDGYAVILGKFGLHDHRIGDHGQILVLVDVPVGVAAVDRLPQVLLYG